MQYIEFFDIKNFRLRFAKGVALEAYRIIDLSPLSPKPLHIEYDTGVEKYKKVLVLYKADRRTLADILVEDLKEGYRLNRKIFPGLNNVLRTNFEIEAACFASYDPNKILETFMKHSSNHNTFPVVILPKCARGEYDSIYYRTKAAFLEHDIPSQVVTEELLQDVENYRWSLLSIAVQIYAKMGGVPYGLERSVIRPRSFDPSDTLVAIAGLGISTHPQHRKRGIGFITVYDHLGVWNFMDFEALSMDRRDDLSDRVADLLERSVETIVRRSSKKNNILVLHYSGKEVGGREEEAIRRAIQVASTMDKFTAVYVLKIKDSDIVVGYEDGPHTTRDGRHTWYPPIGLVLKLKPDVYLMVATGYFIRDQNKVGSNIHVGLPTTKIISRHREVERGTVPDISDIDLLSTVYGLMRLNYVAVNNPVAREPISVRYSREIAWITLRLIEMNVKVHRLTKLKNAMWFL